MTLSHRAFKILIILSRLVGIKYKDNKFDCKQLLTALWTFLISTPIGLTIIGTGFPIAGWGITILIVLVTINLDETIVLSRAWK